MLKSPFPGMDPYLESLWLEVHARLIVYAANQLNAQLEQLRPGQRTPYLISVYRDAKPEQFEVYRAPLEQPLPNIHRTVMFDSTLPNQLSDW